MCVKKQFPSLSKFYTNYEEVSELFFRRNRRWYLFFHNISDIALIGNRIVRVSKSSKKKFFAFKLFQFCNLKNQQKIHSWRGGVSFIKRTRSYFEQSTPVFEKNTIIVWSFQLYTLYPNQSKRLILLSLKTNSLHINSKTLKNIALDRYVFFCFERNKERCFSIKKFRNDCEQNVLTNIINLRYCEVQSLHKNRNYIASKCGLFDSIYDIWLKHSCSGTLARSKYSATHRRGDLTK